MRLLSRFLPAALLILLPATAFAMQETVWDFRNGNLPGTWKIAGLETPVPTEQGLSIKATEENGSLLADIALPQAFDVIHLTFLSAAPSEAKFL